MAQKLVLNRLAIVIPAYKSRFFENTIQSIADQTCKDFNLYIGDDASSEAIRLIVEKYQIKIPITYKRFDENLGGIDLVSQWERCIDLVQEEEWIWLFSDDDIMSDNCVEEFYRTLEINNSENVRQKIFRFNLSITDENLKLVETIPTPEIFSVEYFLENYFVSHKFTNRMVEFIFSKSTYMELNKFENFPLAWGSDITTMLKFGKRAGYVTIKEGNVFWRSSGFNVSAHNDPSLDDRKAFSYNLFYLWIFDFIQDYKQKSFYNKIIYRTLHHITFSQARSHIKNLAFKDSGLIFKILSLAVFIKFKGLIKHSKIKEAFST